MDISELQPLAPRSSWFPWRHARPKHGHPALRQEKDTRTLGERVADNIASFGGSWPFIFIFLGLILFWMLVNTLFIGHLAHGKAFDPYPYIALNLVLSALAGLQAPIIMMSQNRAAARDEILAHHHYEETQKIDELLRAVARGPGVIITDDRRLRHTRGLSPHQRDPRGSPRDLRLLRLSDTKAHRGHACRGSRTYGR